MYVNLNHAAWSNQGAEIGGGVFTPAECADAARKLEAFDDLLAALESFVALLPSNEGLGGHAPMGAFIVTGHKARAAIAKAKGAT